MIHAACHCGAVRLEFDPPPKVVNDCNCTVCSRYAALWAYALNGEARIVRGGDQTEAYIWGRRMFGLHRCRTCGCVTHATELARPDVPQAVNARMFAGFDPNRVTIRRTDNGHSGHFWTREDGPIAEPSHPPMPPRGPDDWL